MNRPSRKKELEVRVMFETNRQGKQCVTVAYEWAVPINRRPPRLTMDKQRRNSRKVSCRAGGAI